MGQPKNLDAATLKDIERLIGDATIYFAIANSADAMVKEGIFDPQRFILILHRIAAGRMLKAQEIGGFTDQQMALMAADDAARA